MKPAKHKIAVIDKNENLLKVIHRTPISHGGMDSYVYKGELFKGYYNGRICGTFDLEKPFQAFIVYGGAV
jgi:hypothetical protein